VPHNFNTTPLVTKKHCLCMYVLAVVANSAIVMYDITKGFDQVTIEI
jgi:hypothetical protein